MKPEVKEMWLAALRSGVYKQGQGSLRKDDKYCCLGVLCDLAVQNGVIGSPRVAEQDSGTYYEYGEEFEASTLPETVVEWAGMDNAMGVLPFLGSGQPGSLVAANDGNEHRQIKAHTFEEIADLIEAHL